MSFADYQALLDQDGANPANWSPRECVWLMLLAQQRGSSDLVERLREALVTTECASSLS